MPASSFVRSTGAVRPSAAAQQPTSINPDFSRLPTGNVRRRGRERWQARVYVGGRLGGSVSLGMYPSETAAAQVARRVLRMLLVTMFSSPDGDTRHLTPLDVWKAAKKLADNGFDVDSQLSSLLPRGVCLDGCGGYGIRVKGGNGCDRGGFPDALSAYREVVRIRKRLRAEVERERDQVLVAEAAG